MIDNFYIIMYSIGKIKGKMFFDVYLIFNNDCMYLMFNEGLF